MKRTLLLTLEYPPQLGGVAGLYGQLAEHLPADRIIVLAPPQPAADRWDAQHHARVLRNDLLATVAAGGWPARRALLKLTKQLPEIIVREKIELLLVGHVLPLGTAALWLSKKTKLPYATFTHGLDILRPQQSLRKRLLLRKILLGASTHLVNSGFTKHQLETLGAKPGSVHIVRPGPCGTHRTLGEAELNHAAHRFGLRGRRVLLTVGRLVERKRHDVVLRALPAVLKNHPDVTYAIVGSGPELPRLEGLVRELSLDSHVIFFGAIPDSELSAFYQMCEIFVMPASQSATDAEGFGIVFLEANAYGKPVIGAKSGGIPEAIKHEVSGLLIAQHDVAACAQAISRLLNDPSLGARLGNQGMQRVHQEFDWTSRARLASDALSE